MSKLEYYKKNKKKIKATAKYLCKNSCFLKYIAKVAELRSQYKNEYGTHHKEEITMDDRIFSVNLLLEELRLEPIEHFKVYAIYGGNSYEIFHKIGDQFSVGDIDVNDIDEPIVGMCLSANAIGIYVVHNHPYIYKAFPSPADLKTLDEFMKKIRFINSLLHRMNCTVSLIDFAIVTEFDHWSFKQA